MIYITSTAVYWIQAVLLSFLVDTLNAPLSSLSRQNKKRFQQIMTEKAAQRAGMKNKKKKKQFHKKSNWRLDKIEAEISKCQLKKINGIIY